MSFESIRLQLSLIFCCGILQALDFLHCIGQRLSKTIMNIETFHDIMLQCHQAQKTQFSDEMMDYRECPLYSKGLALKFSVGSALEYGNLAVDYYC